MKKNIFFRWPPPSDSNEAQGQDSFIEFKMRQQHQLRKITPQYQDYSQVDGEVPSGVEWEEFEIENIVKGDEKTVIVQSSTAVIRHHENGYKEDGDKKKKKSKYVFNKINQK